MAEFRSKLEDLMSVEELVFDPTPGFGRWRKFFPEDAVKHPAKANLNLIDFLIDKYSREGDLILDPMSGTGSTCVLASLKGRDAICIDIEPQFYQWMEKAREIVEKTFMLGRKGRIINILGDARRLSELLKQIDIIITSPPYADMKRGSSDLDAVERYAERWERHAREKKWNTWGLDFHTEGRLRSAESLIRGYSDNPDNIGNLPLGNIDMIITSPPYAETLSIHSGGMKGLRSAPKPSTVSYNKDPQLYSDNPDNIGNLPLGVIDTIITSPPYESALEGTSRHTRGGIASRDPALAQTGTYSTVLSVKQGVPVMYSPNPDNIGNLKNRDEDYEMLEHEKRLETLYKRLLRDGKPTYLSEMLKVYNEMYKVLKPNGYVIIIIKPFIRNKQVLDLPYYTWLMMEKVGFKLEKIYKLRLGRKSFWRVLYFKKYPDVPQINHEYIIVGKK